MSKTTLSLVLSGACLALLAGCHRPEGGMLSYTGETQTYHSTETSPKTVVLVDTRTEEIIFEIPIPAGKQLVYDFVEDGGDDPELRPSLMRYELMPLGKKYGRLRNSVTVPGSTSRRVDFFVRDGVEYAEAPPEYRLRPDKPEDRPDWWSPRGGPMTDDSVKTTMYDD